MSSFFSKAMLKFQDPKLVTWELKAKQMGLQKNDLSITMVQELGLSCTPDVYLQETEELHRLFFPDVII